MSPFRPRFLKELDLHANCPNNNLNSCIQFCVTWIREQELSYSIQK